VTPLAFSFFASKTMSLTKPDYYVRVLLIHLFIEIVASGMQDKPTPVTTALTIAMRSHPKAPNYTEISTKN
jgi:hypothetical protein